MIKIKIIKLIILLMFIFLVVYISNNGSSNCVNNYSEFKGKGFISIFNESLDQIEILQIYDLSYNFNNEEE